MRLGSSITGHSVQWKRDEPADRNMIYAERLQWFPEDADKLVQLHDILLRAAGAEMVITPHRNPDIGLILSRGEFFEGTYKCIRGRQSECHANSAHQRNKHPEKYRLVTGYALGDDGLWRSHSWLIDKKDIPI